MPAETQVEPSKRASLGSPPQVVYTLQPHAQNYGGERMALATLVGLRESFDVILLAPAGSSALARAEALGVPATPFAGRIGFIRALFSIFRSAPASAVLTGSLSHSLIAFALSLTFRRRIVHIHIAHGGPEPVAYARKQWLNPLTQISIVAVSDHARRRLRAFGVKERRIEIIRNFLPAERAIPLAGHAHHYGKIRRVLMLSKVEPIKRIDLLFNAIDLRPELRDLRFRVLGGGPLLQEMRSRAVAYPNVELPGFVEDVDPELEEADALLHCCPSEAGPLAILEAMAAGLPMLAPDAGGCAELILPHKTGLLFKANDASDLADRLVELTRLTPDELAMLGTAARRRLEDSYDQAARCEEYGEFIMRRLES